METFTAQAAGHTWEIKDARHFNNRNDAWVTIAIILPINAATGEQLQSVKIGRCERAAERIRVTQGPFGILLNDRMELTDKAAELLNNELLPALEPLMVQRPRSEYFDQVESNVQQFGGLYLGHALDKVTGRTELRGGSSRPIESPEYIDLEDTTPAERERLRAAWREAFEVELRKMFPGE